MHRCGRTQVASVTQETGTKNRNLCVGVHGHYVEHAPVLSAAPRWLPVCIRLKEQL